VNNSHKLGLALFAIGVILFIGQGYVLSFFYMTLSFVPPDTSGYSIMSQAGIWTYSLAFILIISGVVMFYKGRKESSVNASSESSFRRDKNIE
jgi:hypothetical protein